MAEPETVTDPVVAPPAATDPVTPPPETPAADESKIPEGATIEEMWKENKELRKENAERRVKSKQFEDTFSSYAPEQQEAWIELVSTFSTDPKAAAAEMQAIAKEILEGQEEAGVVKGDPEYVSKEEVAKMLKEQVSQIEIAREAEGIQAEARKLGYDPTSTDKDVWLEYKTLVDIAMTLPSGSVEEADKIIKAREQRAIDRYLKSKAEDAGKTPPAPVAGGSAPSHQKEKTAPKSLEDVEEQAVARVQAMKNNV